MMIRSRTWWPKAAAKVEPTRIHESWACSFPSSRCHRSVDRSVESSTARLRGSFVLPRRRLRETLGHGHHDRRTDGHRSGRRWRCRSPSGDTALVWDTALRDTGENRNWSTRETLDLAFTDFMRAERV